MTRTAEPIVMSDSAESAQLVTVTGWKSRRGIFYGEDERTARYDGCTHRPCEDCGKQTVKHYIYCVECRDKRDLAKYLALPKAAWDGVQMIYANDEYFPSLESFLDHCDDEGIDPTEQRPLLCEPNYAREVDPDYWCDETAEDGELPDELEEALSALNAVIRKHKFILSWSPGKTALALGATP